MGTVIMYIRPIQYRKCNFAIRYLCLGMVPIENSSTQVLEAIGSIQGQPQSHSKFKDSLRYPRHCLKKGKKKKKEKKKP